MCRSLFRLFGILVLGFLVGKMAPYALQCAHLEAFDTFSSKLETDSGEVALRGGGVGAPRALTEEDEHLTVIVPSG